MRILSILLVLITSFSAAKAQTSIRLGMGYYLWGSGDLLVPSAEVEVRRDLSSWFAMGLESNFGHYSSIDQNIGLERPARSFTTFALNLLIEFKLLDTDWIDFSLIGGSSTRYQHQLRFTPLGPPSPFGEQNGTFRSERFILSGGHIRPEAHFHLTPKDEFNFSASTSIYNRSEIFSGLSVSYMRKI